MDRIDVQIRLVKTSELVESVLEKFNRYQVTNRVLYTDKGQYFYKDDHFIESWNREKKHQVIEALQNCIKKGGSVIGAFKDGYFMGFASVENEFFGNSNEYLELSYIHISYEYRGCGIGKRLFEACCEEAKKKGAKKLYISSHPAEETQSFYKSRGCIFATYINKKILAKEPLDIQLECIL